MVLHGILKDSACFDASFASLTTTTSSTTATTLLVQVKLEPSEGMLGKVVVVIQLKLMCCLVNCRNKCIINIKNQQHRLAILNCAVSNIIKEGQNQCLLSGRLVEDAMSRRGNEKREKVIPYLAL